MLGLCWPWSYVGSKLGHVGATWGSVGTTTAHVRSKLGLGWPILGLCWGHGSLNGSMLAHFEVLSSGLRRRFACLRPLSTGLRVSCFEHFRSHQLEVNFGLRRAVLQPCCIAKPLNGPMLAHLGAMLGLCWPIWGLCWGQVRPSWGYVGAMLTPWRWFWGYVVFMGSPSFPNFSSPQWPARHPLRFCCCTGWQACAEAQSLRCDRSPGSILLSFIFR